MTFDRTMEFRRGQDDNEARRVFLIVAGALRQKGYNPIAQISGYLISGDPAYITNHEGARNLIRSMERDDLIEELVRSYLKDQV